MSRCCICGSKFSEGMRPLLLTRGNPQELVCGSCVKILKGLQDRAAEGSADYPAALDAISDVAEGNATPFARSYLREYITRTNETWESKTERSGRNGANARPTFAEGPGNRPREPRRTAEKFCPACGGKNPAGNRFCLVCGKPLSAPAPQNSGDALKRGDPIKNVLDGMIEGKAEPGHGSAEEKRGMLTDLEKVIHPAEEEYGPQAEPKHTERKQSGSLLLMGIFHKNKDYRLHFSSKVIIPPKTNVSPAGFPAGRWRLWLGVGRSRLRLGGLGMDHTTRSPSSELMTWKICSSSPVRALT